MTGRREGRRTEAGREMEQQEERRQEKGRRKEGKSPRRAGSLVSLSPALAPRK